MIYCHFLHWMELRRYSLGKVFPVIDVWGQCYKVHLIQKEESWARKVKSPLAFSTIDSRVWSLSSAGLFSVKSFFMILSKPSYPILFLSTNFVWKSKALSKVKAFVWLVVHKKVNTNDMLQVRRPYKSLSPHWCILCKESGKSIDHPKHCPIMLGLWHKLFSVASLDWVPPRSIGDMMIILFRGLGNSIRGKMLWHVACFTVL